MAELTEHAKLKMRERGFRLSDAMSVVENPTELFYDTITGCNIALGHWRSSPTKQLLVPHTSTDADIKIIALFVLSKAEELTAKRMKSGRWPGIKQD